MRRERSVRLLTPADWRTFRAVRLQALADAPLAFGSTLSEERERPDRAWGQRLAGRACFAAWHGQDAVGVVCGIASDEEVGAAELISMWVHPAERGTGIAGQLVDAVLAWAAAEGYGEVRLWVTDGNDRAERLYARHGFRRTGGTQPYPNDPERVELEMRAVVQAGASPA